MQGVAARLRRWRGSEAGFCALFDALILTALTALAVTPAAMAERRALVIGLNTYDDIQPLTS